MIHSILPGGPTVVRLGAGAAAETRAHVERLGLRRALVLATPGRTDVAARVASDLGDLGAGVLGIAEEHVPLDVAARGRAAARARGADGLVAVGGGSTIGLAKAIALDVALPILALPTTFSGSEMTPIWGLTEGGVKRTGRSPDVRAACVLYDPELARTLPAAVAVPSAFNALAHAVEALYAPETDAPPPAVGDLSTLAEQSARALAGSIPALAAGDADTGLLARAFEGACLAGACLGHASMGLHHKLCHVLGGTFGLPHALTHAVLLPYVARFNLEAAPRAHARLERALEHADPARALFDLGAASRLPRGLAALGFTHEGLPRAVALATTSAYPNPRPVTDAAVRGLLEAALEGAPP